MSKILIIDDEQNILTSLGTYLKILGYEIYTAKTLGAGREGYRMKNPDIVILDIFLQGEDGLGLLDFFLKENPKGIVIVISGHADLKVAIDAIKRGAYDFFEKPVDTEKLKITLENALKQKGLSDQVENFKKRWLEDNYIVGSSRGMREIIRVAEKAGPTNLSVLIHGESGTGKELLAYYIHLNSRTGGAPYIVVNCAAIQPELFESTLFGHKKGSFTGAIADKPGFFKTADGGTLFLDEVGEIPFFLQAKLLRAIEYGEIQGVGYDEPLHVNTRIIAATNRDLETEIAGGGFREDLFFRLSQVPLYLPSLKERRDDIELFIHRFQVELEEKSGLNKKPVDSAAMEYLKSRDYPGNIRELWNLVGRLTLLGRSGSITIADIHKLDSRGGGAIPAESRNNGAPLFETTRSFREAKRFMEKRYIEIQLKKHHFSIKETAAALEMLPNNLSRKINELEIVIHK